MPVPSWGSLESPGEWPASWLHHHGLCDLGRETLYRWYFVFRGLVCDREVFLGTLLLLPAQVEDSSCFPQSDC